MSVPNPRREAYRILTRVEEAGAFASVLLESGGARLSDPRDVALLTEIVLGVLRRRALLDHAIEKAAGRPVARIDPSVLTAIRIGAFALYALDRTPAFAAVDTAVDLVKDAGWSRAAGFANGVLRTIARERAALLPAKPAAGDVGALSVYRSHPLWWTRRVVDRFGWDRADQLLASNNESAATVLAPASDAGGSSELAAALGAEDVVVEPCRFVPEALRVVSGVPQRAKVFRDACWVQDEASQLAVKLFGGTVGPLVLDACAAPGGKTMALAPRIVEGGLLVAADRHARRLARLKRNLERLRIDNVVTVTCDMSRRPPFGRTFDEILVDAPCSGTGTLRRHPEIRWRLTPEDLPAHAQRQRAIVRACAELVRPGGRLVYSVCSIEPEEGDQVIAAFLAEHPEFSRSDPRPGLSPAARTLVGDDLALRTTPLDDGMDGFFAALLTRRRE